MAWPAAALPRSLPRGRAPSAEPTASRDTERDPGRGRRGPEETGGDRRPETGPPLRQGQGRRRRRRPSASAPGAPPSPAAKAPGGARRRADARAARSALFRSFSPFFSAPGESRTSPPFPPSRPRPRAGPGNPPPGPGPKWQLPPVLSLSLSLSRAALHRPPAPSKARRPGACPPPSNARCPESKLAGDGTEAQTVQVAWDGPRSVPDTEAERVRAGAPGAEEEAPKKHGTAALSLSRQNPLLALCLHLPPPASAAPPRMCPGADASFRYTE